MQQSLAYDLKPIQYNFYIPSIFISQNHSHTNQCFTIYAESNTVNIFYPEKIQLFGDVYVKYNDNIIQSDTLTILNNKNNNLNTILYAIDNVRYYNKNMKLKGSKAKFNLNNKDIDLYQGMYHLYKSHIYGTANFIMQRKNNSYTIMKNNYLTNCKCNKNHWNVTASDILYDWEKNNMYIWNVCFNVKNIPIFYTPYLSFFGNQKMIFTPYIPTILYNTDYGIQIQTPFPLFFSKYYSGTITPYYASNFDIGLNTTIYYFSRLGKGSIITKSTKNNKNYFNNNKIFHKLHWKHHGIINKKWHIDIDYINHNNLTSHSFNNINKKFFTNHYNYINQKFSFYYNNKHWKTSIIYFNTAKSHKNHINQNLCIYSANPQLEIKFYANPICKNKIHFQTLGQLSQFLPSNYIYPNTIRIHIEPIINFIVHNPWIKININTRLCMTHYKQKNLNFYNTQQNQKYHLANTINRVVPKFTANGTIIFQKKTNSIKSHKYFMESKIQYSYIPNILQENIGIYDTKIIYKNYNNLFYDKKNSGLDRIQATNQFIGNITMHCFKKYNKLFSFSIGQILNLNQNKNFIYQKNNKKNYSSQINTNDYVQLISLGSIWWNVNNYLNISAEMQYDTLFNRILSGNTIFECVGKKHKIFQLNYRYINTQYLQKNLIYSNDKIYYKTISQIGFIICYPIKNNWTMRYLSYFNNTLNTSINQAIEIKYSNSCYTCNISFERNIVDWNNRAHINLYENKIRFNYNLIPFKSNIQKNPYKFFMNTLIPYQTIH